MLLFVLGIACVATSAGNDASAGGCSHGARTADEETEHFALLQSRMGQTSNVNAKSPMNIVWSNHDIEKEHAQVFKWVDWKQSDGSRRGKGNISVNAPINLPSQKTIDEQSQEKLEHAAIEVQLEQLKSLRAMDTWRLAKFWVPTSLIGILLPWFVHCPNSISFALGAMIVLGVFQFLCELSSHPDEPRVAEAYIVWMFLFLGLFSIPLHMLSLRVDPDYWNSCVDSNAKGIMSAVITGASVAIAQYSGQTGFGADLVSSGPHASVMCSDAVIVAILSAFYLKEIPTCRLVVAMGCVLLGGFFMQLGTTSAAHRAVGFMALSSLCYACTVFFMRLGAVWGLGQNLGIVLRMGFIGLSGVAWLMFRYSFIQEAMSPGMWLFAPFANAVLDCFGIAYVLAYFNDPQCVTVVGAIIFASNFLIVCFLNIVALHHSPPMQAYLGMTCSAIGTIICISGNEKTV